RRRLRAERPVHMPADGEAVRATGNRNPLARIAERGRYAALRPAVCTTLVHRSISAATNLAKSAGDPPNSRQPRSARRCRVLGSARPALISLLSLSTISGGVSLGAAMPYQPLAS